MEFGTCLILILSLFIGFYYYLKWNNNYWKRKGLIYDKPNLIFGSLLPKFKGEKHYAMILEDLYRKYSENSIVGFFRMTSPVILIRDPEIIKETLVKNFNNFHENDFPLSAESDPILSKNPFILKGDQWKVTRGRLTPGFTNNRIKCVYENMYSVTKDLKEYLQKHSENLNAKEIAAKFTTDVVAKTIFGVNGNSFIYENAEFREMGTNIIASDFLTILKLTIVELAPFIANTLKLRIITKKVENFFKNLVKESMEFRQKNNIDRNDFFNLLMQLHAKHPEFSLEEMTSHSVFFFSDGFETSSTAMAMTLYELAKNPEIQSKARSEVDAAYKKYGSLTFEAITESLSYLENCLFESMRLHPPVTYMQRLCTKKIDIINEKGKSITIEPGITAAISILALHHDEKHYPEPMVYRPERFSNDEINNRHRYAFLPFGEGPRICLGIKFALTQTKLGLAFILRNFDILNTEQTPEQIHLSKMAWLMVHVADQTPYIRFRERTISS